MHQKKKVKKYVIKLNIPIWNHSKIKQIAPIALIYDKDVKLFVYSKVLDVLVKDILSLR